jgi:hypothetical protein
MILKYVNTTITLPPGTLSSARVRMLLMLVLERYKWFIPKKYNRGILKPLASGSIDYQPLMEHYKEMRSLHVMSRGERDYLMLFQASQGEFPYIGNLHWGAALKAASGRAWRAAHLEQVAGLMRFFDSPYAIAAEGDDITYKDTRLVDREGYQEQTFTVRDYSEGLAGLFWRNFYGPPFVRLFGERLNALPPECVTRLGEEFVLVQPYELPTAAGTKAARAREQHLISLLGPECFYDHEHHLPPTRRPVLPPAPWPAPGT